MLNEVYQRLPVPGQNLFASGYGLRELSRRHRGGYARAVADLERRERWSPEQLVRDQAARVRSMATWCATRVPHYRDVFAELGLSPEEVDSPSVLSVLPTLEKEAVRSEPERFLPDGPRPRLVPQTTGGTTGTPVRYWATLDAVRANYATYEARCRRWAGARLGQRLASFHGQPIVPERQRGGPYWRRNPAFHQTYFSVYHLNQDTIGEYLDELARFRPEVIAGYTSAVHRIAVGMIDAGQVGRIRPAAVIVSSETLTPVMRRDMETAFGCRVTNAYSLGELVAFVSECEHGELHISTEYGVIELLDGPLGTEIVATTLINQGMPLLRYRTGDLAVAADAGTSSCGRGLPVIHEIIGRVDDAVRTPEGATVGPAPMSLAFQRVPHLRRTQVRQDRVEELLVLVEVDDEFSADDETFMVGELRKRLGPTIRLVVEHVDELPRTSGGKERLVVSTIGSAEEST